MSPNPQLSKTQTSFHASKKEIQILET